VTDKQESPHFCVPDVLAVLFAVYMKGKGSSVCGWSWDIAVPDRLKVLSPWTICSIKNLSAI
jgi:hypothetical protein